MTFDRLVWKNEDPSTPLSAENLNRIEQAIVDLIDELDLIKENIESNSASISHMYETLHTLSLRVSALVEETKYLRQALENCIQYNEEDGAVILG
jgi:translation initiation factor 2B subunit (eIF-2B alpha/beta/delta family)